jgi:hypothetical protein
MTLASIPSPATDGSSSPMDAYLLEAYREAAESARPSTHARFVHLTAFLAIVSLLTATLAVLFSVLDGTSGPIRPVACMAVGVIGLVVSLVFYAMELRRSRDLDPAATLDVPTDATAGIYQASIGFFGFVVAIATALLLVH